MDRKKQKTATDAEIIVDYIESYGEMVTNMNLPNRGWQRIAKHLDDLDQQMLKRGILSEEQIRRLRM